VSRSPEGAPNPYEPPASAEGPAGPLMHRPAAILALLTLLNFVNYLDRFLVTAVAPKIQDDLGMSNTAIGLITSAFMFGYFLTSPAFGWFGDRHRRKGLIAAGVAVWSIATAASGLAETFGAMFVARVFVGVGEASYASLAPTIIDDIAPPEKKNRYLAIFYLATPVGSALGFILGGLLEHSFGWRNAFFIAGGPGVLLALATLLIHEPVRAKGKGEKVASPYGVLARRRLYVLAVGGYIAQTFALGGFVAWAPQYLTRALGMELHAADFWLGAVAVVTGFIGTAVGGYWADHMKGDRVIACLKICALSSVLSAPFAALCLVMRTPASFFAAAALCELSLFLSVAPTNTAIMTSVPVWARASAMAVSIFAIHLLGDLISPPLIGAIADAAGGGGEGIRLGMYLTPAAFAVSAVVWIVGARARPQPAEET
jgi:MFS transporter, Spinster family, sphingosine-1-phosphate transporter